MIFFVRQLFYSHSNRIKVRSTAAAKLVAAAEIASGIVTGACTMGTQL